MMPKPYATITREQLAQKLNATLPVNHDRVRGYALVNVLEQDAFENEHIPQSINIPIGQEDQFEQLFAKDKEIIVYCASPSCNASPRVAQALTDRGFTHVVDFDGGMSNWKEAGYAITHA